MDKILKDPQFQQILAQLAEQQKESVESLTREAAVYLREMRSKQSPMANAIWIEFIRRVSLRGYDQFIDVNPAEIRKLTRLSRRHPIAYTLTHKTYIDTLVLSLVLSRHGMPLPYAFAGANLDLPIFGDMSRQVGSIFIRRSFKDNYLYKWTLRYFIASLLNEKAHFMWAIEGTRSRTGKIVWPKMGILKYILESEQDSNMEVKYIPTSIVYDLIPDVKKMTEEGLGKGKNPENIMWLFDYLRSIGGKFGRISIRFDDPVDLAAKHSSIVPDQEESPFEIGKPSVSKFAFELVHRINQITPVTTVSLICISLLSKYALTKKAIELDVMDMMQFIEKRKSDALVDRGKPIAEGVQYALNLMSQAGIIKQQGEGVNVKHFINTDQYLSATYYANMAVHHLYHRAFIELALVKIQTGKHEDRYLTFWKEIMELRDLFKFEFFYSNKGKFSDEIEADLNLIDGDWQNRIKDPNAKISPLLKAQKVFIAQVILNTYVEAYRVIAFGLENWNQEETFNEKRFINECLVLANEMHYQGRIRRIEVASKPFLINGLRVAKNRNLIPTADDSKKEALREFINHLDDVSRRIQSLQEIILERPRIINTKLPAEIRMVPGSKTYGITQEISDGESGAHIAAFFDMDRTLIKDFSAKEFFRTRLLSGRMTSKEIAAQFSALLIYASGSGGFAQMAAVGAQGIKGIKEEVFIEVGEEVYLKHLSKEIYPEARALVNAHLAKGHTVAIISAATPYQVNPVARDLDIDHVMCTRMEVQNGTFTGKIVEPACWGEGKVKAALDLKEEFDLDFSKSYFYTDSAEDASLLEIVGNPRPINPDTKLAALAFQNDWPIYRFNEGESSNSLSNIVRTGLTVGSLIPATVSGIFQGVINMSWQDGVNAWGASLGDLGTALSGMQLVVKGEEHLWSHRPAVFLFNHQSGADLLICAKLIRQDMVGIAKKELQYTPLGPLLAAAGVIFINRTNREKAIQALKPAVDALKGGKSVVIAPEGTRSKDYNLGSFKKGAFHLAMQAGVPLIPIVIKNAHDVMPKGSSILRPSAVDIVVLPPVSTEGWDVEHIETHIKEVRDMYLEVLGQGDFAAKKQESSPDHKSPKTSITIDTNPN